jgi:hypothetical protein
MALPTAPTAKAAAAPQITPITTPRARSPVHHHTPRLTTNDTTKNTTVDNITVAAILERILHPIVCVRPCDYASVRRPTLFTAERSLRYDRSAAMSLVYYSWAKASRNLFSCSSGRLVEMISKSYCFSSSITLSGAVAPLVKANSAEVPSVTFSRT